MIQFNPFIDYWSGWLPADCFHFMLAVCGVWLWTEQRLLGVFRAVNETWKHPEHIDILIVRFYQIINM